MAVTLARLSGDISRQRASTIPSNMSPYNPSEIVPIPMPEQYHRRSPESPPRHTGYTPTSAPVCYQNPYYPSPQYYQSPAYHQSPTYYQSPFEHQQYPLPIPPKHPIQTGIHQPPSPQQSEYSSSSGSSPPTSRTTIEPPHSRTSIEPDQLPPHSTPQVLTQTQSQAFEDSQRIPAVRIGKDEVWNSQTRIADFRIAREAARMPSFLSTKPLLTVTKTSIGISVGSIRFHTVTSNKIELTIKGRETAISHSGVLHNRWGFQSTSCPNSSETWYWKKDKSTGGAMLEDSKRHGQVLARMKGNLLTFEKPRLSQESYDEIVVSALAMAEAARRQKRKSDIADLASAIGDFTGSDGGDGGNGGGIG